MKKSLPLFLTAGMLALTAPAGAGETLLLQPGDDPTTSYQLLCARVSAGAVAAASGQHRLLAVAEFESHASEPRSENYRLRSTCLAGQYQRDFFLRLFRDAFRQP